MERHRLNGSNVGYCTATLVLWCWFAQKKFVWKPKRMGISLLRSKTAKNVLLRRLSFFLSFTLASPFFSAIQICIFFVIGSFFLACSDARDATLSCFERAPVVWFWVLGLCKSAAVCVTVVTWSFGVGFEKLTWIEELLKVDVVGVCLVTARGFWWWVNF